MSANDGKNQYDEDGRVADALTRFGEVLGRCRYPGSAWADAPGRHRIRLGWLPATAAVAAVVLVVVGVVWLHSPSGEHGRQAVAVDKAGGRDKAPPVSRPDTFVVMALPPLDAGPAEWQRATEELQVYAQRFFKKVHSVVVYGDEGVERVYLPADGRL